jgi:hypothetical protein
MWYLLCFPVITGCWVDVTGLVAPHLPRGRRRCSPILGVLGDTHLPWVLRDTVLPWTLRNRGCEGHGSALEPEGHSHALESGDICQLALTPLDQDDSPNPGSRHGGQWSAGPEGPQAAGEGEVRGQGGGSGVSGGLPRTISGNLAAPSSSSISLVPGDPSLASPAYPQSPNCGQSLWPQVI